MGRRIAILRRLAHPELDPRGRLLVVTAATRSLIQPLVPGLGDLEPVVLREGTEIELEHLTERLVDLAYARVEMVEKRGEFAVRGGIVDLFPPTAESPVRIEFWGDEVSELRCFSVADQRSLPDSANARPSEVVAPPCRELLLTADVRERAAELVPHPRGHRLLRRRQGALRAARQGRGRDPHRGHGVADPRAAPG